MLGRCNNPMDHKYPRYGGRGIKVCDEWSGSYERFFQDMGPRPSCRYSLDRIDVNGNYEPGNCRWATMKVQSLNKEHTVKMTLGKETKLLMEWAEITGLSPNVLYSRRGDGWSDREAILTPLNGKREYRSVHR